MQYEATEIATRGGLCSPAAETTQRHGHQKQHQCFYEVPNPSAFPDPISIPPPGRGRPGSNGRTNGIADRPRWTVAIVRHPAPLTHETVTANDVTQPVTPDARFGSGSGMWHQDLRFRTASDQPVQAEETNR